MEPRDKRKLKKAFGKVFLDVMDLKKRLSEFEGDVQRNIRVNLKELKDKLADGVISAREYDERYKRILDPTIK